MESDSNQNQQGDVVSPAQGSGGATSPVFSRPKKKANPLFWILGCSALAFVVFMFLAVRSIMRSGSGSDAVSMASRGSSSSESIGVLELNGVIMESKKAIKKLEAFAEDESIKAVVVRLNSPGGAVAPSQEIYQAVKNFSKPLVVSMSSVAASGAFYVACGAKKVFANPGTITGSIGVIMEFANLEKLYEWAKVKRFSIKTGRFKDAGAEYRQMDPEEKALLQGMVDDVLVQFKDAVRDGRKLNQAQVDAVADGRIFSGSQAHRLKLVDELGTFKDAVRAAAEMAGLKNKDNPKLKYLNKFRPKIFDFLMEEEDDMAGAEESTRLSMASWFAHEVLGLPERQMTSTRGGAGVYWLWTGPVTP